jgi:cupin 2 domain-containing protein
MLNLFSHVPKAGEQEFCETICTRQGVRIERIVSHGQTTPAGEWYDQSWDEWVLLLTGSARLLVDGDESPRSLGPGDHLLLPAGRRHRVEWTDPDKDTVWLAVHIGEPFEGMTDATLC